MTDIDDPVRRCPKTTGQLEVCAFWFDRDHERYVGGLSYTVKPRSGSSTFTEVVQSEGPTAIGGQLPLGSYTVEARLTEDLERRWKLGKSSKVATVTPSGLTRCYFSLQRTVTVVTGVIEAEYVVIPIERGGRDDSTRTEPVRLELSLRVEGSERYDGDGAKLTANGLELELYETFEGGVLSDKVELGTLIPRKTLTDKKPYTLYAKGLGKGQGSLQLTPTKPNRSSEIELDAPQLELAVLDLPLTLYKQDMRAIEELWHDPRTMSPEEYDEELQALELPPPIAMSEQDKHKWGGLVHVQRKGHHGRTKISLPKLESLPSGADQYALGLALPDNLAVFAEATGGSRLNAKSITTLGKLLEGDATFWLEGSRASQTMSAERIALRLDRKTGGVANEAKENLDWAAMTVVQIESLELVPPEVDDTANSPWNEEQQRYYINLQKDPDGRAITLRASLSEKIEGVPIHFMLVPDENNRKAANWGVDLPEDWTWQDIPMELKRQDRQSPDKLLHLMATTDEDGVAQAELVLSRVGGDIFHPAAYIGEDPHLAQYVHGVKGAREPVFADYELQVWRKVLLRVVRPEGFPGEDVKPTDYAVQSFESLAIELECVDDYVYTREDYPGLFFPAHDWLDDSELRDWRQKYPDRGDSLVVVGTGNAELLNTFPKQRGEHVPQINLFSVDKQYDQEKSNDDDSYRYKYALESFSRQEIHDFQNGVILTQFKGRFFSLDQTSPPYKNIRYTTDDSQDEDAIWHDIDISDTSPVRSPHRNLAITMNALTHFDPQQAGQLYDETNLLEAKRNSNECQLRLDEIELELQQLGDDHGVVETNSRRDQLETEREQVSEQKRIFKQTYRQERRNKNRHNKQDAVTISFEFLKYSGPYGGWKPDSQNIVVVADYSPNFQTSTITVHEIGHIMDLVPPETPASGMSKHPHQYFNNGSHCGYEDDETICVMAQGDQPKKPDFCSVCHPYVLFTDLYRGAE